MLGTRHDVHCPVPQPSCQLPQAVNLFHSTVSRIGVLTAKSHLKARSYNQSNTTLKQTQFLQIYIFIGRLGLQFPNFMRQHHNTEVR